MTGALAPPKPKHDTLNSLTGIRGVGAVWVLINHLTDIIHFLFGVDLESNPIFGSGYFAVDMFFILSGFILAHIHYNDFKNGSLNKYRHFMALRVFRIYPLHVIVMFALLAIVVAVPDFANYQAVYDKHPDAYSLKYFPITLLLIQNWGYWIGFPWNGSSWNISIEMLIYIVFPFCVPAIRRLTPKPADGLIIGTLILAVFGFAMFRTSLIDKNSANIIGIIRGIAGFSAGCFLNMFYRAMKPQVNWSLMCLESLIIIVLALTLHPLKWMIYIGFGMLILSLAHKPRFFETIFGSGVILWLGQISFSIYLTHLILLHLALWQMTIHNTDAAGTGTKLALLGITVLGCMTVAQACHYGIELPARRLGRSFAKLPIIMMPNAAQSSGHSGNT